MDKRELTELQRSHRENRCFVDGVRYPDIVARYLPPDFDVDKSGYPRGVEMILQWEIRHRGCIYAARDIFLGKPLPNTAAERIEKWYICMSLIETATRAFEDLHVLLDWYMEHWNEDTKALNLAMTANGVNRCAYPHHDCPSTLHAVPDHDKPDEPDPCDDPS